MKMKLGDKVRKTIRWVDFGKRKTERVVEKVATGKVVYIHPLRRYYTLEFNFPGGTYRECFKCCES